MIVIPLPPHQQVRQQIQQVILAKRASFRRCYDNFVRTHPGASGIVTTRFTIDDHGAATNVSAIGFDDAVETCVVAALQALTFPKSLHGAEDNYPFIFQGVDRTVTPSKPADGASR